MKPGSSEPPSGCREIERINRHVTTNLADLPELIPLKQAAEYLGVSLDTLKLWKRQKRVSFTYIGPSTARVKRSELQRLINAGTT